MEVPMLEAKALNNLLSELALSSAKVIVPLEGGTGHVYRIELEDGTSLVLKNFHGKEALPEFDVYAAGLLASLDIPVTKYLIVDNNCTRLPFVFALTNYLPGSRGTSFANHPNYSDLFGQIGGLARKLHTVNAPRFGTFPEPKHADNSSYIRELASHAFERFLHYGGEPQLESALRFIFERDFLAIVPATTHAVFAHDDLHLDNILVVETETGLSISGLIDFGNARAHSAVMDLAKTIFICEHMAPGSGPAILQGYGTIDHPRPQEALAFYTMLHRVIMWWWLRHIGVLATADSESDLIDALRTTAFGDRQPA
jgi:Ser/Thr protein kinase RdoA (MazF antagonist)